MVHLGDQPAPMPLIQRLAREAPVAMWSPADGLQRFAALVAEECAKAADEMADADAGTLVGEAIRAKFQRPA